MVMIHGHQIVGVNIQKSSTASFYPKNTVLHSKELHVGQKCGLKVIWN